MKVAFAIISVYCFKKNLLEVVSTKQKIHPAIGLPFAVIGFLARKAGPELVGTIGSRSAVVNNDQIVVAVSQGVASAVAQANQKNGNICHFPHAGAWHMLPGAQAA